MPINTISKVLLLNNLGCTEQCRQTGVEKISSDAREFIEESSYYWLNDFKNERVVKKKVICSIKAAINMLLVESASFG